MFFFEDGYIILIFVATATAGFRKADVVIQEANYVAGCASLKYAISSLEQCNSTFYNDLYRSFTGSSITFNTSSEENRCQILIDALELHLSPWVTLPHIRGYDLANLSELSITHMLDVFSMLFEPLTSLVQPCGSTYPAIGKVDVSVVLLFKLPCISSVNEESGTPLCSSQPLSNDDPSLYHSSLHAKPRSGVFPVSGLSIEVRNSDHHSLDNGNETSHLGAHIRKGAPLILESLLDSYLQDILHPSQTSKPVHRPMQTGQIKSKLINLQGFFIILCIDL